MSDEAGKAVVQEPAEKQPLNFFEQVNEVVGTMEQSEDGTWDLPEGDYSDELRYAAGSEKRRRDIQSSNGKLEHKLTTMELENKALKEKLQGTAQPTLSAEETAELDELKFSDPEAWRVRMNELDTRAASQLTYDLAEVSNEVTRESEITRRQKVLDQFNSENPDTQITQELVTNDVPPRITKKLEDGKISFEEFLDEVKTYVTKGKVVKNETVAKQPNLGEIGGTAEADANAVNQDMTTSYKDEIF